MQNLIMPRPAITGHSITCDLQANVMIGCSCGWWNDGIKPLRFLNHYAVANDVAYHVATPWGYIDLYRITKVQDRSLQ